MTAFLPSIKVLNQTSQWVCLNYTKHMRNKPAIPIIQYVSTWTDFFFLLLSVTHVEFYLWWLQCFLYGFCQQPGGLVVMSQFRSAVLSNLTTALRNRHLRNTFFFIILQQSSCAKPQTYPVLASPHSLPVYKYGTKNSKSCWSHIKRSTVKLLHTFVNS